MGKIIAKWAVTAAAVAMTFMLVPGIGFTRGGPALDAPGILGSDLLFPTIAFAAVLAVMNTLVKPVLKIITLPITIITLGLSLLVINVASLYLASYVSNAFFDTGLEINSFVSAMLACILISLFSAVLNLVTGANRDEKKSRRDDRRD